MKRIDELGISPWPWRVKFGISAYRVRSQDENCVTVICSRSDRNDANLIAAAPELYEALQVMTELFELNITEWNKALVDSLEDAKKALAKAAGEEVN